MAVGRRAEPGDPPAHTEPGNADALAQNGAMRPQPIDRGVDVGDNFRVAEMLDPPGAVIKLLLGKPVKQIRRDRGEPGLRQPVGHIADELIHAAPVLADNHRGERPPASGNAGVHIHILVAYCDPFPKRRHPTPPNAGLLFWPAYAGRQGHYSA